MRFWRSLNSRLEEQQSKRTWSWDVQRANAKNRAGQSGGQPVIFVIWSPGREEKALGGVSGFQRRSSQCKDPKKLGWYKQSRQRKADEEMRLEQLLIWSVKRTSERIRREYHPLIYSAEAAYGTLCSRQKELQKSRTPWQITRKTVVARNNVLEWWASIESFQDCIDTKWVAERKKIAMKTRL